jgi:PAS domain S-box-containing protein
MSNTLLTNAANFPMHNLSPKAGSPQRDQVDESSHESEAKLRGILETAVDGIIIINERGIVESCNPAAERIFGYAAPEVVGQNIKMLMPPLYREAHDTYIANYLRTGEKRIIGIGREVIGQHKDGRTFPIYISVSEVRVEERRLFTGIVHDLTEQKRLEQQVLQAERLATIGKMAAKVAHEIRNPLSSISLNAELLEDEIGNYDCENTEEAQALLKSIIAEIDRVTALTEEYLQFSRLPESQLVHGNLNGVVEEVIELLSHELAQKKIAIECHVQNAPLEVRFDRIQIRRALLNIIRNAVDAMPKGGKLKIWMEKKDRQALIYIEDNGIGIPDHELQKIFDPFFTTKDFGTGLGLAIVLQIINEHSGQISCQSKVGAGTKFSIALPLDKTE